MVINRIVSLTDVETPLSAVELSDPCPRHGEVRIKVSACGVCHTELDEIEGRTAPPRLPVVPGHEVVGRVDKLGAGATRFAVGERVGIGWIHSSSGSADENLSPLFRATGRDIDGGYAEFMTVPETYAYPIPAVFSDAEAAPLLCAGGVGYRSLRLAGIEDGQRLGLTGFGGSAHIVLQLARHMYPRSEVFVLFVSTISAWRGRAVFPGVKTSGESRRQIPSHGSVARIDS
jgi:propanol-preferring alcohol dehydrogenase